MFLTYTPTKPSVEADALKICIKTSNALGNNYTVVSQDLAIYEISYAFLRENSVEYSNLKLCLEGFHMLMNFLGAIGKLMIDSGVEKIFVDAKVLLEGTAKKVMTRKGFYQATNSNVQLYESVLALWWQAFEDWNLKEKKDVSMISEIGELSEK